ncbi:MAG: hypothetical protein L6V95_08375 [Candidatus Melainabacteria bacterium]|nr:MAG: hypothetical protein L6V95_08375 [Candidatus Melainabacteria bacterium]
MHQNGQRKNKTKNEINKPQAVKNTIAKPKLESNVGFSGKTNLNSYKVSTINPFVI